MARLIENFEIKLDGVGHRYGFNWIFRHIEKEFSSGNAYAITGSNGSGKSTLLRVLSGYLRPIEGKVRYTSEAEPIEPTEVFKYLSFAAPYIELIEEYTLIELLDFHTKFKPLAKGMDTDEFLDRLQFPPSALKNYLSRYSSGMKQRVKLALAIFSSSPLLLLDEPSTNLDISGIDWYHSQLAEFKSGKLLIIASNAEEDYARHTSDIFRLEDYKS